MIPGNPPARYTLLAERDGNGWINVGLFPAGCVRPTYRGAGRTLAEALESLARNVRGGEGVF